MSERLTVVPLDQVRGVEIKCACGTGFTFTVVPPEKIKKDDREIPKDCPICGESMGTAFHAARKLWEFYSVARNAKTVAFRVSQAEAE